MPRGRKIPQMGPRPRPGSGANPEMRLGCSRDTSYSTGKVAMTPDEFFVYCEDWRQAIQEDFRRTQMAFVASWQAAIISRKDGVTTFDPDFVWPNRGTRKNYNEGY